MTAYVDEWKPHASVRDHNGQPIPLTGEDYLIIAPGQIELRTKGQTTTCSVPEIDRFEITKGVVTLRRKDAASGLLGIGARGTFTFEYKQLANAKLCVAFLDRLFGVDQVEA